MIVYILKHSNSEFSGGFFGVGFDKGRGSTSSKVDRDRCVQNGCKDITSKVESIKAASKKKAEAKAAKVEAEKKAEKKEKEEIPGEAPSKEPLEEKTEEPEKEKK